MHPLRPGQLSQYPEGISDVDDEDGLLQVMFDAFAKSADSQAAGAVENALKLYDAIPTTGDGTFSLGLLRACAHSPQASALYDPICTYLNEHEAEYGYCLSQGNYDSTLVRQLLWNMSFIDDEVMDPLINALLSRHDEEAQKKVLRMVTDELGIAPVINGVRRYVEHQQSIGDNVAQQQAEKMGRWLLGLRDSSLPFHTALEAVYQNIRFENYRPNVEAQMRDETLLTAEIRRLTDMEGAIVDLGCGTGRLSNRLSELGYTHVVGLDNSGVQIAKAKEGDTSGDVTYVQASWKKTGLPEDSAKIIYALGRSLPHTERSSDFAKVSREVSRVLQTGGEFFFDMPNPDKGSYLENRRQYLENLRAIGTPVDEAARDIDPLSLVDIVIDSPDGINFYNRYTPSIDTIVSMLRSAGFEVEEAARARITDQDEAETIYFRATKRPQESVDQILARLAATEPALS
jgi:SAM-dependent methyltransferase